MNKKYVVVDVGCIECGEGTCVFGIFDNTEQAHTRILSLAAEHGVDNLEDDKNWFDYFAGGQHSVGVYTVEI